MSGISLSGLFSGMDTNMMITQLMALEKIGYNKLDNRKKDYTNQQSQFRTLNTKLNALRDAAFDLTLRSNYTLTTGTSSDTKIATISSSDGAVTGDYALEITQLAKSHSIRSEIVQADAASSLSGQKITVNFGEKSKEITLFGATNIEVLNNLKNEINSGGLGVTATVVQTETNKIALVLTASKTGESSQLVMGTATGENIGFSSTGTVLQDLKLFSADGTVENLIQAAQNAEFKVNGLDIVSESNEVSNVIQNATFTLLDTGNATINVKTDVDKIADKVDAFVKAYNEVIAAISAARNFTDASGRKSLQGDSTLRSLETQISNWLNSEVGGDSTFKHLFQIGLEVDKGITRASEMTGKINFDKEKFKKLLIEDPEAVYQVLAGDDTSAANKDGIARLFSDNIRQWSNSVDGFIYMRINGFDKEIKFISDQMEQMNVRLAQKEEALRKKFTAMESALASLQNQQMWLNGQIATMLS